MKNDKANERGLGLIELIVAVVVAGIVVAAMATILVNSWRTQEDVTSVTQATNRGQVVSSAIERAVRNALFYQVSDGGTVLRVSTSLEGSLKCQGFRLIADGAAHFTTSATALNATLSTWPDWQDGIRPQGTMPFFDDSAPGTVSYAFEIETDSAPVRFSGEVGPRSVQEGNPDSCW
ncbi:prepilin-type N-terminal cleavage/methylation domain-containing protein [Microbacter sp. GSS18]|nr:prepilin-type N-terminal cleavage/methylation domain-containing protein [Microbacter sp. GSS18]